MTDDYVSLRQTCTFVYSEQLPTWVQPFDVLAAERKDGTFHVTVPELPGFEADFATRFAVIKELRGLLTNYVEAIIVEKGVSALSPMPGLGVPANHDGPYHKSRSR